MSDIESRLQTAVAGLPKGLADHIYRVQTVAVDIAERHGLDIERAALSALGHDLVRHKSGPELLTLATEYGVEVDEVEKRSPILVHGPIAARMLERDFDYHDTDVICGVDCHTTARAGMSPLEQALFIADKVEPHKLAREPQMADVVELASESLDAAVLRYLDYNVEQSLRKGWLLHHRTLEARNELLVKLGRG